MFKKILVPLDGSDLSEAALAPARQLLEAGAGEVILLAVASSPGATRERRKGLRRALPLVGMAGGQARGVIPASAPQYAETKGQAIERVLHEHLDYLDGVAGPLTAAGGSVHGAAHFGDPAKEIVAFAEENGIDLIVMATHGRSGLRETLHGSVTAAVIKSGVAPVLVVPPKGKRSGGAKPAAGAA